MATAAQLKKQIAELEKQLQDEVSWGASAIEDTMKPAYRLLEGALAASPIATDKVKDARKLLHKLTV